MRQYAMRAARLNSPELSDDGSRPLEDTVVAPARSPFTRRTLLAGLGVGAALTITAGSGTAAADPTDDNAINSAGPRTIRCLSFNIHHAAGVDTVLDLERIARVIADSGADVVGLQEVDRFWARSEFVDQPAWFAERLGMHAVFGANLDLDPDEGDDRRRQYGTAILTTGSILDWSNTALPHSDNKEQRGLLHARIRFGSNVIDFYNTHLDHTGATERIPQCNAILGVLGRRPRRSVLVGDFNCKPDTEEWNLLTSRLDDSWHKAGDGDGYTYPAPIPDGRLDYVLGSRDLRPISVEVVGSEPDASDHLPVATSYRAW